MTSWKKRYAKIVDAFHTRLINYSLAKARKVLEQAAFDVANNYQQTGRYKEPDLNDLDGVFELFYEKLIEMAVISTEKAKKLQDNKVKLNKMPWGKPRTDDGRALVKDKVFWRKTMSRADRLSGRFKKAYLRKLRKLFSQALPEMNAGNISPDQFKKQMVKAFDTTKHRVETIFKTETSNYASEVQVKYFEKDEDIIGFMFVSELKSTTTDICRKRHGLVYRPDTALLAKNKPALHYNCGSLLIPLANTPENRKMLTDPSRDPNKRKVPPLPKGWRN